MSIYSKPVREKLPFEQGLVFLTGHIKTLISVTHWAHGMGYSRSHFSRNIRLIYSESAVNLFHKAKLTAICTACQKKPHAKAFTIAKETGFENGKSMGQFLWHNFGIHVGDIRKRCGNGFNTGDLMRLTKEEIRRIFRESKVK